MPPDVANIDPVAGLLTDLDTITSMAQSGVRRAAAERLEPGETRPAAILFLDVVGFTALARVLDTENLSRLIDRSFRIFELTVKGHGGYCDKVIGDAALYVFAGHVSYEPPCQAALSSALALQQRVAQINQSLQATGLRIDIRCGVSFGMVTRQRIGGESQQITVMGETVNLAQRLETAGEPGSILTVGEVVEETSARFEFSSCGPMPLKGFGELEVFHVEREKPREVRLRGSGLISPLVGRDDVLTRGAETVEQWWADDQPGGRLLLLQGPTAVGKSRSAWELTRRLREHCPLATATAHCTPQSGLLGFATEVCQVAGISGQNLVERWDELTALAERQRGADYAAGLKSYLPLLAYLLDCPQVDTAGIRQADSASFAQSCQQALRTCFELAALEGRRVVLVVEDVQWLGEQRELLAALMSHTQLQQPAPDGSLLSFPLICIATARQEYDAAGAPALLGLAEPADLAEPAGQAEAVETDAVPELDAGSEPDVAPEAVAPPATNAGPEPELAEPETEHTDTPPPWSVLRIEPLDAEQGAELFARLLPGVELPPSLEAELHEKSLGLPYYYEEMARLLLRRGIVEEAAEGVGYRFAREIDELEMPDDFRTLILGRLDLLHPELRELAQHASVLGRTFEPELLAELNERSGVFSGVELHTRLLDLKRERLLGEKDGRFYFYHLFTYQAAYSSLLTTNLRLLHGAAADLYRARTVSGAPAEREFLPLLYRHLVGAQRFVDAHRVCCDMLQLINQSGGSQHWDTWEGRAEECWRIGNIPLKSPELLRARAIRAWHQGDMDFAAKLLESSIELARALSPECCYRAINGLGALKIRRGSFGQAELLLREALSLARTAGDVETQSVIIGNLGIAHHEQNRLDEALRAYRQALILAEESGNRRSQGMVLGYLAAALIDSGQLREAKSQLLEALDICKEVHNAVGVTNTHCNLGHVNLELGELIRARHYFDLALESLSQQDNLNTRAFVLAEYAQLLVRDGQPQEAQAYLESAVELAEAASLPNTALYMAQRAELSALCAEREKAQAEIEQALGAGELTSASNQALVMAYCARAYQHLEMQQPAMQRYLQARQLSSQDVLPAFSDLRRKLREIEEAGHISAGVLT